MSFLVQYKRLNNVDTGEEGPEGRVLSDYSTGKQIMLVYKMLLISLIFFLKYAET
jgi:hypothetical protein